MVKLMVLKLLKEKYNFCVEMEEVRFIVGRKEEM